MVCERCTDLFDRVGPPWRRYLGIVVLAVFADAALLVPRSAKNAELLGPSV